MQELLRNAGRQLEALLTPSSLLQLAAILVAVLLALMVRPAGAQHRARQGRAGPEGIPGTRHRSGTDRQPALRRAGAGRGVRRRAARDQGAEPAGRSRDHARRAHAADPPRRLHRPRLARQPHQGLGQHHHVRRLGRAGAARARLVRSAGAGARQRRHQCRQGQEDHAVVGAEDPVHRRRLHAGRGLDRALVRTAADGDAGPGAVACASASRSSRRRS